MHIQIHVAKRCWTQLRNIFVHLWSGSGMEYKKQCNWKRRSGKPLEADGRIQSFIVSTASTRPLLIHFPLRPRPPVHRSSCLPAHRSTGSRTVFYRVQWSTARPPPSIPAAPAPAPSSAGSTCPCPILLPCTPAAAPGEPSLHPAVHSTPIRTPSPPPALLPTPHPVLHIRLSALSAPHCALHYALHTLHPTLRNLHMALHTPRFPPHSSLYNLHPRCSLPSPQPLQVLQLLPSKQPRRSLQYVQPLQLPQFLQSLQVLESTSTAYTISIRHTPHSTFYSSRSTLSTPHSAHSPYRRGANWFRDRRHAKRHRPQAPYQHEENTTLWYAFGKNARNFSAGSLCIPNGARMRGGDHFWKRGRKNARGDWSASSIWPKHVEEN